MSNTVADSPVRRIPLGPGCLVGSLGNTLAACSLAQLAVRARLAGPLAAVEVMQTFSNPYPQAIEFCYLFPLTTQSTVFRFRAQVGERTLEGLVGDKASPCPKNHRPAFLAAMFEREQAPVFSVGLGLVEPGQQITVELAYAELLPDLQFRLPLLVAGRLRGGASLDADQAPAWLDLPDRPTISVQIEVGQLPTPRLRCTQPIRTGTLANGDLRVELAQPLVAEDFVISLTYAEERPRAWLRHSAHHFVVNLTAPLCSVQRAPRDLIVLVDLSDNATAPRFQAAQRLTQALLSNLREGEQFALVGFHHQIEGFEVGRFQSHSMAPQALEWLRRQRPAGRADMAVPLDRLLSLPTQRAVSVVLIACGKVGNEPELYAQVCATPAPPRFFAVGLDTAVNAAFLRRLGAVTRGSSYLCAADDSVPHKWLEETRQPWISQVEMADQGLAWVGPSLVPSTPPNLTEQAITILGLKSGQGGLELHGYTYAGHGWSEAARSSPCLNPALPLLWANQKVSEMLDELKLTSGPRASQIKQISGDLCREYRLFTELTSFVVGGGLIPSLHPWQWTVEIPTAQPVRLRRRLQLEVPAETSIQEVVAEPKKVRAGLVSPQGESPSPHGLRPKLSRQQKYNPKPTPSKPAFKQSPAGRLREEKHQIQQSLQALLPALVDELRALCQNQDPRILAQLLRRLRAISEPSPLLQEIYRLGVLCYQGLQAQDPQAGPNTLNWAHKLSALL